MKIDQQNPPERDIAIDQSQHHIAIHLNQNIHKKIYVKIEQQSLFFLNIMQYNVVFPARHEIVSSDTLWNFLVKNQVINLNDIHKIKLGYRSPVDPKNGFGVFLLLVPKELFIVQSNVGCKFIKKCIYNV